MKMGTIIVAAIMIAVCGSVYAQDAAPAKDKPVMIEYVYVCPDCHAAALKPGKCACGEELVQMHLLGTKDGQAIICTCGSDCNCDFKGMKDGKCACGKDVKMASMKGLYVCPQGCPVVSEKPGKCACGRDMKKVE